jgi:ssRNA-specific RNase YbeY (16S rRNA maturation enzyme)
MGSDSSDGPSWYRNRQRKVRIQDAEIEKFLAKLSKTEAQGRELAVLVASDDCVRRTNWRFRGKQGSTDVLSFPDGEGGRLGDILISAARAERQAHEYGHSVEAEVKTLILHGSCTWPATITRPTRARCTPPNAACAVSTAWGKA